MTQSAWGIVVGRLQDAGRAADHCLVEQSATSMRSGLSAVLMFGELLAIIVGTYAVVESTVAVALENATATQQHLGEGGSTAVIGGALAWSLVVRPLSRRLRQEREQTAARETDLRQQAQRQEFDGRLTRALEMASTEEAAHGILARTLRLAVPEYAAEVLLADSSDAHLKSVVQTGSQGQGPECGVTSPRDCAAIRRGQTVTFDSSEDIDACPHLQGRAVGVCSATCVPVNVAGRSIGVLHVLGADRRPPEREDTRRLETVATLGGSRLGMLRVIERTSLQAATDPLTGLMNRRTLEAAVHPLLVRGEHFAVAMGDLDHFKRLNDTHGHEVGDRALRLFARALRSSVRAEDLVCRFGGEEFVAVFPRQSAAEAADVLRRTQEELLVAVAKANVPGFTVSYGVTDTQHATSLDDLLRLADLCLFRAKREGRNRVAIHDNNTARTGDTGGTADELSTLTSRTAGEAASS